jgi:hypothetical protein
VSWEFVAAEVAVVVAEAEVAVLRGRRPIVTRRKGVIGQAKKGRIDRYDVGTGAKIFPSISGQP